MFHLRVTVASEELSVFIFYFINVIRYGIVLIYGRKKETGITTLKSM